MYFKCTNLNLCKNYDRFFLQNNFEKKNIDAQFLQLTILIDVIRPIFNGY